MDEIRVGHGMVSITEGGSLQHDGGWEMVPTRVCRGASIGSNATIVCGITIGRRALVGAGAVVTRDVPDHAIVAGNPARVIGDVRSRASKPQTDGRHPGVPQAAAGGRG